MKNIYFTLINHPLTRRFPILRRMIKYGLVGATNVTIDWTIYFSLTRFFEFWKENYLAANLMAFSAAATWSFFINKKWTFRNQEKKHASQYCKFLVVCFIGLLMAEFILYIFVDFFKTHDLWGKVAAIFIVYFWNFFMNHWWTFKGGQDCSRGGKMV